ncbi:MAG TPA: cyanophycinase [Gemmatimonadaceae bacterium]|nr:cyanophycinase [Gemmatimonadaceae bacterium]
MVIRLILLLLAVHPKGTLFIVGGGPQPPALVKHFVELAGGTHARIVVFGMASSDGVTTGVEKAQELHSYGAEAFNLFITPAEANTDSVIRQLSTITGVWFSGGDQVKLMAALRGTRVDSLIHAKYRAGAVIAGTSAGAAVMSTPMITGDERRRGGDRPPTDSNDIFMTIARGNIVTASGFGLIEGAVVDQHFIRRRRNNRLLSVVLEGPVHLGVGIDESTALIVHPDGRWSVEGASAAVIYDARHARINASDATALGAAGVVVDVLPAGSTFDPSTGRVLVLGKG